MNELDAKEKVWACTCANCKIKTKISALSLFFTKSCNLNLVDMQMMSCMCKKNKTKQFLSSF